MLVIKSSDDCFEKVCEALGIKFDPLMKSMDVQLVVGEPVVVTLTTYVEGKL